MNQELERLIDFALADGILTDKEKEILYKKAIELGVDIDEFEMILNGKLHIKQKEMQQEANLKATPTSPPSLPSQQPKNKEGDFKKCPSCGAPTKSFSTKCQDCGHEFRNIESSKSVQEFFNLLQRTAEEIRKQREDAGKNHVPKWGEAAWQNPSWPGNIEKATTQAQTSIINTFPIPNTKEDILEFLSMALPQAKVEIKTLRGRVYPDYVHKDTLRQAWISKCEQVIIKAKFSMKDDKNLLNEIEAYANQLPSIVEKENKGQGLLGRFFGNH